MRKLLLLCAAILFMLPALHAQTQVPIVSGVVTINLQNGVSPTPFKVILNQNVTSLSLTNPSQGQLVTLILTQDATGGRTVTFASNITGTPTITSTANATTVAQLQFDANSNTWFGVNGAGGGLFTSLTGDGDLICNSGSTGAVTLLRCSPIVLPTANVPSGSTLTIQSGATLACAAGSTCPGEPHALGWAFGDVATGSTLTTSEVGYITIPYACTITGWHIMADAGTVTIETARVNGGTALPTLGSNSISTSGVSLATGTKIDSTTVTDFTSTAIAKNDTLGFFITTVATAKQVTFQLDCQ